MIEQNNTITLYPSNWLYNAGVVGLKYLDELEDINGIAFENGSVQLSKNYFDNIDVQKRFFAEDKTLKVSIVGKSSLYPNFINSSRKQDKEKFYLLIKSFKRLKIDGHRCGICTSKLNLSKERIAVLNKVWTDKKDDFNVFYSGILEFSNRMNGDLGGASSLFPNGFWNLNDTVAICPLCSFIFLHHHLALTKLSDSEIFINAPSFKIMYELNKLVKETYGAEDKAESKNKREILATTVIEYSRKIKSTLGIWTGMNLEIVIKSKNGVDFFSLPFETIKLISDRNISAVLSDLGEFKILDMVLDRKFSSLVEFGYRLIRLSSKGYNNFNEADKKLLNDMLYRFSNKQNLTRTATQILKLYSLIEEKQKGVNKYEYSN